MDEYIYAQLIFFEEIYTDMVIQAAREILSAWFSIS